MSEQATADPGQPTEPADIENNLKSRSTWTRLVFMIVVGAIYAVSRAVLFAVVILQFLSVLFTAEPNERLTRFGHSLAIYTAQITDFLCYVTEERPFPFDRDWPDDD